MIGRLYRLSAQLRELPCPLCGGADRTVLLRRDRYFLPVDVATCRSCGLVHTARTLDEAGMDGFYRDLYPRLMSRRPADVSAAEELARIRARVRLARLRDHVPAPERVLEIGCGLGYFLKQCRDAGARQVFGVEPGPQSRDFARGLGLEVAETLDIVPFRPQVVALFHVLEHLADPREILSRIAGLIDPEGWLVIEVPDILGAWDALGVINFHVSHRSYFCAETLTRMLAECGFQTGFVAREPTGIYPGNLRIFARLGPTPPECVPPVDLERTVRHIRALVHPWSLANGYPRMAARLLRLALH